MDILKIIWDARASDDLNAILGYCNEEFGKRVAFRVYEQIHDTVSLLAANPRMGKVFPYKNNFNLEIRVLTVKKQNQVIYTVHDGYVYIHMIRNTRENPTNYMLLFSSDDGYNVGYK